MIFKLSSMKINFMSLVCWRKKIPFSIKTLYKLITIIIGYYTIIIYYILLNIINVINYNNNNITIEYKIILNYYTFIIVIMYRFF